MNTSTLTDGPLAALYEYWATARLGDNAPAPLAPQVSPVRYLTDLDIASLRIEMPSDGPRVPKRLSIVSEAALRVCILAPEGPAAARSGWNLARVLQDHFYPHSRRARRPLRGLELLRLVDATRAEHGVAVVLARPQRLGLSSAMGGMAIAG
jgi:hypothetical protein